MSIDSGQIVSGDLSPNAGIQGFQIADQTIQTRNFAAGAIPANALIGSQVLTVAEGPYTASLSVGSVSNGLTKTVSTSASFVNTYTTIPIVFAFASDGSGTYGLFGANSSSTTFGGSLNPFGVAVGSGSGISIQSGFSTQQKVTSTGVTFSCWFGNGSSSPITGPNFTILFYVMQQKAA